MNEQSTLFVKNCIRSFYMTHRTDCPSEMDRREFAIIEFDRIGMQRHLSFDKDSLHRYLIRKAPKHVYYSAALWQTPDADKMAAKGWQGTELTFDIDIKPGGGLTYPDALVKAKQEMLKLIDCIKYDLGVNDLEIVFSGRKGYHCHVYEEGFLPLDGDERREIVDYITGNNGMPVVSFPRIGEDNVVMLPNVGSSGRGGRFNRTLAHDIGVLSCENGKDELIKNLVKIDGIGKKRAKAIYNSIIQNGGLEHGIRCKTDTCEAWKLLCNNVMSSTNVAIDQPITIDVHRVIRLPGSIHGETGLRVTRVKDLDTFDPLTDAVCLSTRLINIVPINPFIMEMNGECFRLQEGAARVPEYLAVFSICSGLAEIAV